MHTMNLVETPTSKALPVSLAAAVHARLSKLLGNQNGSSPAG